MPSGKQILLSQLTEYSQRRTAGDEIETASERIRAGLLLHGSTSHQMWKTVSHLAWVQSHNHTEGRPPYLERQGLGLGKSGLLLSDLFEALTDDPAIAEALVTDAPKLSKDSVQAGLHVIWLLLKALEWSKAHEAVEIDGSFSEDRKTELIESYVEKLKAFEENPDDFS